MKSNCLTAFIAITTVSFLACVAPVHASKANGTCLMALYANKKVQRAERIPGSTAGMEEIIATKSYKHRIEVVWKAHAFMRNGKMKIVLRGKCITDTSGKRIKSITFQ